MSHDEADEAHSLIQLDTQFSPHYVGEVIVEEVRSLQSQMADDIAAINRLIPQITNMYCEDRLRRYAEREIFRLQTNVYEAMKQLHHRFNMAVDVGRPATITT